MANDNFNVSKDSLLSLSDIASYSKTTIEKGVHASLEIVKTSGEPSELNLNIDIQEDASLDIIIVDLSNSDSNMSSNITLLERSNLSLKLGALSEGKGHKVYKFDVNQKGVKSHSLVSMLGVATDSSKLEFLGTTKVFNGAKKANARQEGRIANLSPDVVSTCSPALLIDENDIIASHGAALGQIDENQLFYLMSRGLTKAQSEKIITLGYLKPVINMLSSLSARDELNAFIESKVK